MATYGLSIEKRMTFRGQPQHFSNVYYYKGGIIGAADLSDLIDKVKAIEVDFHGSDVTFTRARGWSAGGGPAANEMMVDKVLSGTGGQANNTSMDRERAMLIQWAAGKDIRGRVVRLRKWYHCCGNCVGHIFTSGEMANTAAIPSTDLSLIEARADDLNTLNAGTNPMTLTSKSNRNIDSGQPKAYKWLEHHQLGDEWR